MKANICNNVAEIGKRVKMSESVWLDCKSVLEKLQLYVSCEISIYIVFHAETWTCIVVTLGQGGDTFG